jgi:hypothetical protein
VKGAEDGAEKVVAQIAWRAEVTERPALFNGSPHDERLQAAGPFGKCPPGQPGQQRPQRPRAGAANTTNTANTANTASVAHAAPPRITVHA